MTSNMIPALQAAPTMAYMKYRTDVCAPTMIANMQLGKASLALAFRICHSVFQNGTHRHLETYRFTAQSVSFCNILTAKLLDRMPLSHPLT